MTIFKCKMCGGALEINNETVATCEYCGTMQTIPRLSDDKRANLYDRANHFRRNNEYDKAMAIYEQILLENQNDAEAYWSIVLCHYGIEYVEDPATHRRIPTVNRVQLTSILDDENYKAALKHSDRHQKDVYENEAKEINKIQKGILAISEQEDPYDVFICYKETDANGQRTTDSVLAQDIYTQLEQEGMRVFFARITLEDQLGSAYEPYIFAALNSAKVMIVVGTKPEHFNAVWVKNEWSRYLTHVKEGENKTLIPAYKDMDPYDLPVEFSHLQSQDMSKIGFMQDLVRGVKKLLSEDKSVNTKKVALDEINLKIKKQNRRNKLTIVLATLIALLIAGGVVGYINVLKPYLEYRSACSLIDQGMYDEAVAKLENMNYKDSFEKAKEALYYSQKERMVDVKSGSVISFGIYEQDDNDATKLEEISWMVVKVKDGKALLVSQLILDCKPIHSENKAISWKDCDLRNWLNNEFYNAAFPDLYRAHIVESDMYYTAYKETDKIECRDKVFILDNSGVGRSCYQFNVTNVAAQHGSIEAYWSRTRAESSSKSSSYCIIQKDGINKIGRNVSSGTIGVRPAMWISLD